MPSNGVKELSRVIGSLLDRAEQTPRCFGCDFDDMTEEFWEGRVSAIKLGDGLAEPVHYIVPRDGDNDDD